MASTKEIPRDQLELVDHFVWESKDGVPRKWSVDMACIARWSDDYTWYNGVVTAVLGGGQYTLLFIDYGNMEMVSEESIVETARDIPAGECVDLCVERENTANGQESEAMLEEVKEECLMETAGENKGQYLERLEGTVKKEDVKEEEHADDHFELEAKIFDISDSCYSPQDLSQDTVTPSRTV